MPDGVALIHADILRNMRAAVGGDHACVVVDLVEQGYVSRPLYDLQQVTFIGCGHHGNSLLPFEDATFTQWAVLVAIEFVALVLCGTVGISLFCLGQHRRYGAFWPNDQRRSL